MQPAQQLDPGVRAQRLEEAAVHAGKINRPLARHTAIESEPAGECHPHIVRPIPRATPSIGGEVNGYQAHCPVGAAVCVHAKGMKEPWCLVTGNRDATAPQIIKLYSKQWTVEPSFRDTKDLRFGLGLGAVRIADPQRRDRLLLLNAFAVVLLTLLGAAGESLGMDRHLKSNTVKTRSHSLFRQGCMLYDLTPNMPEHRLRPLIERYTELIQQSRVFNDTFAVV